jgi:hypothetical protein
VSSIVGLINFIRWEVGCVDVGSEFGFEWCSNAAQAIEINTTEELVVLDLISTTPTQAILSIADKTMGQSDFIRRYPWDLENYLRIKFSASGPS